MANILIVDDDQDILDSMCDLLSELGHESIGVQDPDEALQLAASMQPALILHDVRMPGLSLAGMVASLRSHPDTSRIPLVLFSAHPDLPRTAAKYDAWGYLRKPFTEPELRALIAHAVRGDTPHVDARTERAIQDLFHDYWNTLSAMAITTRALTRSETVKGDDRRVAEQLDGLLLKLESQTDRLRASLMAVIEESITGASR